MPVHESCPPAVRRGRYRHQGKAHPPRMVGAGHPAEVVVHQWDELVEGIRLVLNDAIKAGAMGYLLKEISIEEVADSIRQVHAGQSLISPSMASKLLTEFAAMARKDEEKQQMPTPRLTDREMEVLNLMAKGLSNKEIGRALWIGETTVKTHVTAVLRDECLGQLEGFLQLRRCVEHGGGLQGAPEGGLFTRGGLAHLRAGAHLGNRPAVLREFCGTAPPWRPRGGPWACRPGAR